MEKRCGVFKCLCSEVKDIVKGIEVVCDCDCSNCEEQEIQYSDLEDEDIFILSDLNLSWRLSEMDKAVKLWNKGEHLLNISAALNREGDETFILLLHLGRLGRIQERKGYIWGIHKTKGVEI